MEKSSFFVYVTGLDFQVTIELLLAVTVAHGNGDKNKNLLLLKGKNYKLLFTYIQELFTA